MSIVSIRCKVLYHDSIVADTDLDPMLSEYMAKSNVSELVFARKKWSHHSDEVADALNADVMKGYVNLYESLTEKISILLYNGNFDMSCAAIGTEAWLGNMSWAGAADFKNAKRNIWTVKAADGSDDDDDGDVAGYWKSARNVTHVIGFGGGHWYPHDQPRNAFLMLDAFLSGKQLS